MAIKRTDKLNSLLQEVISDVIKREVKNPHVHPLFSVTSVNITPDLSEATVSISIVGSDDEREKTVRALNTAAGFIAVNSSKKIVLRHFPTLLFIEDSSVEKQMHIDNLIRQIAQERSTRKLTEEDA
ncbi:MAG: 30S ribosome-binding factor RbfA [Chlamydiae bacterium]|nr:30S ribosome-binding factor RbfA [Chlamydiota bacterium]